jgi:MFS transporter, YNFM family, putative membrane transport protein
MAHVTLMPATAGSHAAQTLRRTLVIGLTAFLTLVDLFAAQAILPSLTRAYGVTPAAMGFAVNASTMGMAVAGLAVAYFSRLIDRKLGIFVSLALLAIPTALLATAPDLATFTILRIVQGLLMSAAFTLTLAYLAEECSAADAAGAFAAYIAGNVASNLFGRLMSAAVADHLGLAANFYVLAGLNVAGALLVFFSLTRTQPMPTHATMSPPLQSPLAAWTAHLRDRRLTAAFAIGFSILFAFIGTFTYVNFVLARQPLALSPMALGFVYLVFAPSIATTLTAGRVANRLGTRPALWTGLGVALAGLPLLLAADLPFVLGGLVLVGVGTFFAQAVATSFVSRTATTERAAASGLYLAAYFAGGLMGASALGQIFDRLGWTACVAGVAAALGLATVMTARLEPRRTR